MSNRNITYLIGAGASAEKLPVVNGMGKTMTSHLKLYDKLSFDSDDEYLFGGTDPYQVLGDFLYDFKWVIKQTKNHASIDTFAKKLYLTGDTSSLNKLKSVLSSFFILEQYQKGIDLRYDLYWASVLNLYNNSILFPGNVNIISWNYDFQFEMSCAAFLKNKSLDSLDADMNMYPNSKNEIDTKKFSIIKLNGSAGGYIKDNCAQKYNIDLFSHRNKSPKCLTQILLDNLKNYYCVTSDQTESLIKFAWENDEISKNSRSYAKQACVNSEVLVIIGYSFPTFNREIDIELLNSFRNLRKIYLQSVESSIDGIKQRIVSIRPDLENNIIPVTGLNEFFIPFEFNIQVNPMEVFFGN